MWNVGFRPSRGLLLFLSALILCWPLSPLLAVEPSSRPAISSEETAEKAQLFIALLKRRAQRILEARRAPPPPLFGFSSGISQGYESNVNLDGFRKGDGFTEESLSLLFQPKPNSWFQGELSYSGFNSNFYEFTDSNLWLNTLSGTLQFQPHRAIRLDLGYDYEIMNFPSDSDSSFFDQRVKVQGWFAHTPWLTHKVGVGYQWRDYDSRKARDSGRNPIGELNRQDERPSAGYEGQIRVPQTTAKIGAEAYRNFSNDQFQSFYDWQDLRFRGVLTRVFSPKWVGSLTASKERKNYRRRSVPAINVAERDDLYTLAGSILYDWNAHWTVSYSLTYRYQDSNDPRLDFTDWINQVGCTVSF